MSRSNQAMKFGQLIDYNTINIFLENSYTKCGGETILRPFSKKLKPSIDLWINSLKSIEFVFIVGQIEDYRNMLELSYRPLEILLKTKRGLELVSSSHFLHDF